MHRLPNSRTTQRTSFPYDKPAPQPAPTLYHVVNKMGDSTVGKRTMDDKPGN